MRRKRGITLVEVLLAAVVCGAGVALVGSAIAASIRAELRAENMARAARLLDIVLGRIEGGVLPAENSSGDFTEDGEPDVTWDLETQPGDQTNLLEVTITVTWLEHGEPLTLDVVRLIYQDPSADTTLGGSQPAAADAK